MATYAEKLKDPRWQKKRLEILNRDQFTCKYCEETTKTLHVHHLDYNPNFNPWDIDISSLITLCEDCHKIIHYDGFSELEKALIGLMARKVTYTDIKHILLEYPNS